MTRRRNPRCLARRPTRNTRSSAKASWSVPRRHAKPSRDISYGSPACSLIPTPRPDKPKDPGTTETSPRQKRRCGATLSGVAVKPRSLEQIEVGYVQPVEQRIHVRARPRIRSVGRGHEEEAERRRLIVVEHPVRLERHADRVGLRTRWADERGFEAQ